MLKLSRHLLPQATLQVQDVADELPGGPFDGVVSALAMHHLTNEGKSDLFARVAAQIGPGGRFVFGDVIIPDDPAKVVIPLDEGYDLPSPVATIIALSRTSTSTRCASSNPVGTSPSSSRRRLRRDHGHARSDFSP